jgi:hypothetical protein
MPSELRPLTAHEMQVLLQLVHEGMDEIELAAAKLRAMAILRNEYESSTLKGIDTDSNR